MKGWLFLLLLAVPLAALAIVPAAQASTNLAVNATIPSGKLLQGQITSTDVSLTNHENYPVRVYKIGVHYDWMSEGTFYALDYGTNYVQIESNTEIRPGQVLLSCPRNATIGPHQYYFKIDITRYDAATLAWVPDAVITAPYQLTVDSPFRQQSLDMLQAANVSLINSRGLNYTGKAARLLLINATESMNEGWSAYYANDFARAINATYNLTVFLNEARNAENDYLSKRSAIGEITRRVNEKIPMLANTPSPDSRRFVNVSQSHLAQVDLYLLAEDFDNARKEAILAESAVNNAFNAQFYYQIEVNQTDSSRDMALAAIDAATTSVAASEVVTSSTATSLLREARNRLDAANVEYNASRFLNATNKANVAMALADQALKADADYAQQQAREKIHTVGPLASPQGNDDLNASRSYYNLSQSAYARGEYRNATLQAGQAYILANNTTASEQAWKQTHSNAIPGFEATLALLALAGCARLARRPD